MHFHLYLVCIFCFSIVLCKKKKKKKNLRHLRISRKISGEITERIVSPDATTERIRWFVAILLAAICSIHPVKSSLLSCDESSINNSALSLRNFDRKFSPGTTVNPHPYAHLGLKNHARALANVCNFFSFTRKQNFFSVSFWRERRKISSHRHRTSRLFSEERKLFVTIPLDLFFQQYSFFFF